MAAERKREGRNRKRKKVTWQIIKILYNIKGTKKWLNK